MVMDGRLPMHRLESELQDPTRAAQVRRLAIAASLRDNATHMPQNAAAAVADIPITNFDADAFYCSVEGTNCENVIGYMPIPVGVVGPYVLDGKPLYIPMATTEGALIASTNRGARAIAKAGGATSMLLGDGMTRAPLLRFPNMASAAKFVAWAKTPEALSAMETAFNSTTRFGKLREVTPTLAGRNVYLRFKCFTGDAMGMNMITKGVNEALNLVQSQFPDARVMALSGNMCTDKKPSAVNWVTGRGKSVCVEVHLPKEVLASTLKTTADALVELNTAKNLVGSAMAGSVGGFNAHASNIVTAVYLATGQDPAQNVESSNCITLFEKDESGEGVYASVTMPSIEVGTVGGGTSLPAQGAALQMMGVRGASRDAPGSNSTQLARIVAAATLAGELSLMAALTTNDLLKAHIELNRKPSAAAAAAAAPAHPTGNAPSGAAAFSTAAAAGARAVKFTSSTASPGRRFFAAATGAAHDLEQPRLSVP